MLTKSDVISRASTLGSKATTIRGAARAILAAVRPLPLPPGQRECLQHPTLPLVMIGPVAWDGTGGTPVIHPRKRARLMRLAVRINVTASNYGYARPNNVLIIPGDFVAKLGDRERKIARDEMIKEFSARADAAARFLVANTREQDCAARERRRDLATARREKQAVSATPATIADAEKIIAAHRKYSAIATARKLPALPALTTRFPLLSGVGRAQWIGELPHKCAWTYSASHWQHALADDAPYYTWRDGGGEVDPKYLPQVAKDGRAEYHRADRRLVVRSYAIIASPDTAHAAIGAREITVTLPTGHEWQIDEHGLHAVISASIRDDYHPTAPDMLRGAAYILRQLAANRELREKMAAERAAKRAELDGVYICVADSLRAGNCAAGTEQWARQHALDPERHYPAAQVYDVAGINGSAQRVRAAITAATIRHRAECSAGVCVLSDHQEQ